MATSYKKTTVKSFPLIGEKITRDALYWKNLEFPVTKKEYGAITHIDFSPTEPHNFAVTNSSRIHIYNSRNNQIERTIAKFRKSAYCGTFRNDGLLLTAGGDEGLVKLFDVSGRALLRTFRGHTGPVHVSKFVTGSVQILTGSDDKSVRVWDIPGETEVVTYNEHNDYVRCGAVSQRSKDIVLTGSYDHTVKVYDTRLETSVLTVDHGAPVESVIMFPTGGIFFSAGGNVVNVWDILTGGRLLAKLCNHHKTVTCMCFGSNNQRLFTGSLDRHVKIYDMTTYQVVHSMDFPDAILSLGVEPSDKCIAVGMASGLLSIQHRKPDVETVKKRPRKKVNYNYIVKNKTYTPTADAHRVEHKRREKLEPYDKYFRRFEWTRALDAVLEIRVRTKTPDVTVSVIQELIRRGGIKGALAGRDDKSLCRIIKFIQQFISRSPYTSILVDIANMVLDLYTEQVGQSSEVQTALKRLKETVDSELVYMKDLIETMGTLETLFAASASSTFDDNVGNGSTNGDVTLLVGPIKVNNDAVSNLHAATDPTTPSKREDKMDT